MNTKRRDSIQSVPPASAVRRQPWSIAAAVVLLLAGAIRFGGAVNDLWLDEIWSLQLLADHATSPLDVFTKIHHDNNHYLNSLWLQLTGPAASPVLCRLLSLAAGIGTVALAALIGRRRDTATAVLAMLLVGFSYVLVLYSSEARGYAGAVFFAFLSFLLLDRYLDRRRWQTAVAYSLSAVLGLLSHLTFVSFLLAAFVWSAYRLVKDRSGWWKTAAALASCHAAPFAMLGLLYLIDLRYLEIGGGTLTNPLFAYGSALAWTLGTPLSGSMVLVTCILAVIGLDLGLRLLWRENSDRLVFFASAVVIFPVALVVLHASGALYPRYFLIAIAFLLLLLSDVLGDLYHRGPGGKAVCVLALLAFLAANGCHIATLLENGRGQPRAAARYMACHANREPATVGGDHDFRIGLVLQFYGATTPDSEPVRYCRQGSWPPGGPEWLVCHKESFEAPVPPSLEGPGNAYEFVKTFPTAPLSGLHWFVFHNRGWQTPPGNPSQAP